jgi:hypothetical protein
VLWDGRCARFCMSENQFNDNVSSLSLSPRLYGAIHFILDF